MRSLEIFYWVAQLKSFSGAAERLNMTQPAVSQRVAMLEAELGGKLFDRGTRSVSLTQKGRQLYIYADRMLRLRSEMVHAVTSPAALTGTLRLGVAETIVHTWLTALTERVQATYPGITLDIHADISTNLREALSAHEVDLAFLLPGGRRPDVISYDLCKYPLAFIARGDANLGREPVPLREIAKRPLITLSKRSETYAAVREALSRPDLPSPRIFTNSSLSTVARMTADGMGIGVIPPAAIARELASGALRIVRTEVALPDLAFTASMPATPDGLLANSVARLAVEVAGQKVCELVA